MILIIIEMITTDYNDNTNRSDQSNYALVNKQTVNIVIQNITECF